MLYTEYDNYNAVTTCTVHELYQYCYTRKHTHAIHMHTHTSVTDT